MRRPGLLAIRNVQIFGAFEKLNIVVCTMEFQNGAGGIQRFRHIIGHARPQSVICRRIVEAADQAGNSGIEGRVRGHVPPTKKCDEMGLAGFP